MTTTRLRRRRLASAIAAAAAFSTLTACGNANETTDVAAAPSASAAPTVGEFCAAIMAIDTASAQMDGGGEDSETVDPAASPSATASATPTTTPSAAPAAATSAKPSAAESAAPSANPVFTASAFEGDLPAPDGSAAPEAESPPPGAGAEGPSSGSGSADGGSAVGPSAEELAEMRTTFDPLLAEIERTKPAAVGTEVDTMLRLARQAFSTGDFDLFDSPEFSTADGKVDTFMDAECGYQKMAVTASDYEFAGLPDTAKAGPTGIKLVNEGKEMHHIVFLRMNDGVTLSADELVALPEAEARTKATVVGETFAMPGKSDTAFFDLKPGRYAAVCFIPKGSKDGHEGAGPPHFVEGMIDETTVS